MRISSKRHCLGIALALLFPSPSPANVGTGTVPAGWHRQSAAGTLDIVPLLNSRPSAVHVLLLDMDGANIAASATHDWNCGNPFTVAHCGLSAVQMREIYENVKEDFLPFNVNVTTDESRYTSAAVGKRMRCIITPSDAWFWVSENMSPEGGRSHTSSFRLAGVAKAADVPCFAFITSFDAAGNTVENGRSIAGAVSHELGHTLGLDHDGIVGNPGGYFVGQGTGPTAGLPRLWSPIMGTHLGLLTQWCNGEYNGYASVQVSPNPASINAKDDLAIIANTGLNGNGFGYAADDHGSTSATASPLSTSGNSIISNGIIGRGPAGEDDEDWFQFTVTAPGTLSLVVKPSEPFSSGTPYNVLLQNMGVGNLNPRVDLYRSNLTTLQSASGVNIISLPANPTQQEQLQLAELLRVRITQSVTAGTYYMKISGVGYGTPASTGYSNYGSLGAYSIDGGIYVAPTVTTGTGASGTVSTPFSLLLAATGNPTSWSATGLPPGIRLNSVTGQLSGAPTAAGTFNANVTATNPGGNGSKAMVFTIAAGTALATATDTSLAWTLSPNSGWFIQSATTHDGVDAAQAGPADDFESSYMETIVTGPGTLTYWWKVNADVRWAPLVFTVGGTEYRRIDGNVDWKQETISIPSGGWALRWSFQKLDADVEGADTGWVDQITYTSTVPTITSNLTASVAVGADFNYQITATNSPTSWGAQSLPAGLSIDGTTGLITGRPTVDGTYAIQLIATNAGGIGFQQLSLTVQPPGTLGNGTDSALDWVSSGNGGNVWFRQTSESQDGIDALRSGAVGNSQNSYLQAAVNGPGNIGFWWRVDSEFDADFLIFKIDGVPQSMISGNTGWAFRSVSVATAGTHFFSWTYQKDGSGVSGADAGWVDQVVWTPTPQAPVITSGNAATARVGTSFYFQVTATNGPTSFAITSGPALPGLTFSPSTGSFGGAANRPGVYPLQVTATNAAGTSSPVNVTITIQSSLSTWASNLGLSGGNALFSADPDRDGRNNLMEMALNLSPTVFETNFVPITVNPTTKRLTATFTRVAAYQDLKYEVQVSDNLTSWTTIASSINGDIMTSSGAYSVTDPGGATPTVVVVDNAAPPTKTKRSMRIKITQL